MPSIRNQHMKMIDYLPDQKRPLLFEIVKKFVPDDVATWQVVSEKKADTRCTARF